MSFQIDSKIYADYILRAYEVIHKNGEYVTNLDLATGDGDHWANMNMGFEKLVEKADTLRGMSMSDTFKEIGKTMMSVIGGSSGVLYGSAYLGAAKVSLGKEYLDREGLYEALYAMLHALIERGQAKPGFKTMIDSLYPAVEEYKLCMEQEVADTELCDRVKEAAIQGAESTKEMEAVKGRATYQATKGIGHLDPGAVTMSYQISELMDIVKENVK